MTPITPTAKPSPFAAKSKSKKKSKRKPRRNAKADKQLVQDIFK